MTELNLTTAKRNCDGQPSLAPATCSADARTIEVANKAEDCILFLRMNRLIRESEVIMIRQKIQKRMALCAQKPSPPNEKADLPPTGARGLK